MIEHVPSCARGRGLTCTCGADEANNQWPTTTPFAPPSDTQGTGAKFDGGKDRWSLLMKGCASAVRGVVQILTFGAQKYSADSWQTVPNGYDRYKDALYRHLHAIESGEFFDKESGKPHWHHLACNALFCATLWERDYDPED